jgi:glycerol-3-phosphate dehydrogenase (NAD(P)+)
MKKPAICVLGDGGWGTTLAVLLCRKGLPVSLWSAFEKHAARMSRTRRNELYLPGVPLPDELRIVSDLREAASGAQIVVVAVPSQYLRGVMRAFGRRVTGARRLEYVSATKGIEVRTLRRMSEVIAEEIGGAQPVVLSGPTIAHEVIRGIPTVAVIAGRSLAQRTRMQELFMTPSFRIYTNADVAGVELGGSLKNVIAIACGISDGLGFGANTKAALLARGLAEMSRLGAALGAHQSTFSGISGLGDLATTCISAHSRNRYFGEQVGRGKDPRQLASRLRTVAEGVPTALSGHALALKHGVDMPIITEVYRVLYKNKPPLHALEDLMTRKGKEESG